MEELEKQYLQSKVEVQESTFSVIGKELHDNVGNKLTSTKMLLGVALRKPQDAEGVLKSMEEILLEIIETIHHLSKSLDPQYLKRFNLIDNITKEIKRNNAVNNKLKIHFSHPERLPLSPENQIMLIRIIQEGIQNAMKHAKAANIYIEIREVKKTMLITITDDGVGFKKEAIENGIGMNSIQTRAKTLGGTATWNSLEKGTELTIQLNDNSLWQSISES